MNSKMANLRNFAVERIPVADTASNLAFVENHYPVPSSPPRPNAAALSVIDEPAPSSPMQVEVCLIVLILRDIPAAY